MPKFSVSHTVFLLPTTLLDYTEYLLSLTLLSIFFCSPHLSFHFIAFSVSHFQCLEKQSRKATKLTISTKDKYKNIPAVTVKIQFWIHGSVDTERPMYSPMKAVRALIKFIRMAILIGSPEFKSTAKSPEI